MKTRRVGSYGVLRDDAGRVLLTRNSPSSTFAGRWSLPGGGVEQGEHPDDALVREVREETGLTVRVARLRTVQSDVLRLPDTGDLEHGDRIVYDVESYDGELRSEVDGSSDLAEWVGPERLPGLDLMPLTARLLGVPVPPEENLDGTGVELARTDRVQRFGAYAAATDPAGRILLTRIAAGYPGAGLWHVPGGGTDHGESPEEALARELFEETGQRGRIAGLLEISHRHTPAALGPEGVPVDWHIIRVLFRVLVDLPTEAVVTEAAGGSTETAEWFDIDRLGDLSLTEVARSAVAAVTASSDQVR